jgi:NAD+ diphosphatase
VLGSRDPHEQITEFRTIPPNALPAIATQLDRLPDTYSEELGDTWDAWGRFRAIVHRAVWDALARGDRAAPEDHR